MMVLPRRNENRALLHDDEFSLAVCGSARIVGCRDQQPIGRADDKRHIYVEQLEGVGRIEDGHSAAGNRDHGDQSLLRRTAERLARKLQVAAWA